MVPACRAEGFSSLVAASAFAAVMASATVGRMCFGLMADRRRGRNRVHAIVAPGLVAMGGGFLFTLALHAGAAVVVASAIVFAFGAMGWNGVVVLIAGERGAPERVGHSVSAQSIALAITSAATAPALAALVRLGGWNLLWIIAALLGATGAVIATTLSRHVTPTAAAAPGT
jgi:MFS family permease